MANTTTTTTTNDPLRESKRYEGSSDLVHLRYHMGPVLTPNITLHTIWYGLWPAPHKRIIRAFLRSICPTSDPPHHPSVSAWWRTVRLYTDQTGSNVSRTVSLGGEKNDRFYSHGKSLTRLSIQSVIRSAITAKTRPLPINPEGGVYLVLTSADVLVQDFCQVELINDANTSLRIPLLHLPLHHGIHAPLRLGRQLSHPMPGVCAYPFAVPDYIPGLKPYAPPNGDIGVDGMVSVIGHEIAELASNPLVNAWYAGEDPSFPTEIADLCEGIYGTGGGGSYTGQLLDGGGGVKYNLNGVGGRRFLVQWIWNPVPGYCSGPNALDQ
ncbi:hypothetical protein QJS10_CPB20g01513 [Acorus calamus]|uniref:Uncharacterized protein n=1 Tax=Acorus calamus TaxID=4465 RepID=A0AAV9CDQ0_ACOCL|nr:hypothetical protein QJS10_CPB20g01513 [Acorus calamus]